MTLAKRETSQNQTIARRAVSVAVAVALAGSFANIGVAAQAYAADANTATNENVSSELSAMADSTVDKTTLEKDLSTAKDCKESAYTKASWKTADLESAITAGTKVDENDDATQTEVDEAAETLQTALDALVEKTTAKAIAAFKARFAETGDDKSLSVTTDTDYAAYAFYHIDEGETIDQDELATNFKATTESTTDVSNLARWILTLTAAGLDASDLDTDDFGEGNDDLVSTLQTLITNNASTLTVEQAAWALPVYQNYKDGGTNVETLIGVLTDAQTKDTTNSMFGVTDYQTVAQAILALAPYCDEDGDVYDEDDYDEDAATAKTSALKALKKGQNSEDGGFIEELATSTTTTATSSVETTSQVVAALVAIGEDPEGTDYTTTDGDNPVSYLLAEADDDYKYSTYQTTAADEPGVAAMVFEALEAYTQYGAGDDEAFDVLEFPASEQNNSKNTTNANTTKTTTTTANTGDPLVLGAAGVIAVAAAGTVVVSRRRENKSQK